MRLKRIYTDEDLYDGIYYAFDGDMELMLKYHILEGGTLEECVFDTFTTIKDATTQTKCVWYHIMWDEQVIGYCVLSKVYSFLYSFGINIEYRLPHILNYWFGFVSNLLNSEFTCALWTKNQRAIRFLEKNGMKLYEDKGNALIYKLN